MDIGEIVDAVIADTSRVDLETSILRWAKAALLRFHEYDYYPKDRVRDQPTVGTSGNQVTLTLPTRWRRFRYIAKTTSDGTVCGIFKPGTEFIGTSAWYEVVGNEVVLHDVSGGIISYVDWVYYEYPEIGDDTETWISEKYGQEVIDLVNWYLYRRTGDLETARSLEELAERNLRRVQQDNLEVFVS
jgi:hypothetical protein